MNHRTTETDVLVRMPDLRTLRIPAGSRPNPPRDTRAAEVVPPVPCETPSLAQTASTHTPLAEAFTTVTPWEATPVTREHAPMPRLVRGRDPSRWRRWTTQVGVTIVAAVLLAVVHHSLTRPASDATTESSATAWSPDDVVLGTPVTATDVKTSVTTNQPSETAKTADPASATPEGSVQDLKAAGGADDHAPATNRMAQRPSETSTKTNAIDSAHAATPAPTADVPPAPLTVPDPAANGADRDRHGNTEDTLESSATANSVTEQTSADMSRPEPPALVTPPSTETTSPAIPSWVGGNTNQAPGATSITPPSAPPISAPTNYPMTSHHDAPAYLLRDPAVPSATTTASSHASTTTGSPAATPIGSPYPHTATPFAQPQPAAGIPAPTARLEKKLLTTTPGGSPPLPR